MKAYLSVILGLILLSTINLYSANIELNKIIINSDIDNDGTIETIVAEENIAVQHKNNFYHGINKIKIFGYKYNDTSLLLFDGSRGNPNGLKLMNFKFINFSENQKFFWFEYEYTKFSGKKPVPTKYIKLEFLYYYSNTGLYESWSNIIKMSNLENNSINGYDDLLTFKDINNDGFQDFSIKNGETNKTDYIFDKEAKKFKPNFDNIIITNSGSDIEIYC